MPSILKIKHPSTVSTVAQWPIGPSQTVFETACTSTRTHGEHWAVVCLARLAQGGSLLVVPPARPLRTPCAPPAQPLQTPSRGGAPKGPTGTKKRWGQQWSRHIDRRPMRHHQQAALQRALGVGEL